MNAVGTVDAHGGGAFASSDGDWHDGDHDDHDAHDHHHDAHDDPDGPERRRLPRSDDDWNGDAVSGRVHGKLELMSISDGLSP